MDRSFTDKLYHSKYLKEHYGKYIVDSSEWHSDYPHLTFRIDNLLEYLEIVKLMNKVHDAQETLVFRGMSNWEWTAMPSLARYRKTDESIEHDMVNEFLNLRPEAFQGLKSNFEILSKMQHFGLPTRLLDFTLNPLVALYFACSENPRNDARVLCSSTVFTDNQSGIINSICSSFKIFSLMNLRLEDLVADKNSTAYQYIARLYLQKDFRPLFVKPQYWNQRIINQSAIFLVFHNALFDDLGKKTYYKEHFTNNIERQLQIDEIAKRENLDHIYPLLQPCKQQHVELKNLTEKLLGNDLPIKRDFFVNFKTMQKVFDCYSKKEIIGYETYNNYRYTQYGEIIFKNRFLLDSDIATIDEDSMKEIFSSIIIGKKAKKKILSDLESLGIENSFIYPELEYTAEKIKRKYF